MADAPLILTAALDEASLAWFDDLRRAHYPAGRNRVPAHLTLFHALPGGREAEIAPILKAACAAAAPMTLEVRGPWSLGTGVAYRIASPALEAFRAGLAERFWPWLTAQDRTAFPPHVTVQNKAEPAEARALLQDLQHSFEAFAMQATGVQVWRYRGGPWEAAATVFFGPEA